MKIPTPILFVLLAAAFAIGLLTGSRAGHGTTSPHAIPTEVEVWRPCDADGPRAPVVLTPCHVTHNGEPVYDVPGDTTPPWKVVFVYHNQRIAVLGHCR